MAAKMVAIVVAMMACDRSDLVWFPVCGCHTMDQARPICLSDPASPPEITCLTRNFQAIRGKLACDYTIYSVLLFCFIDRWRGLSGHLQPSGRSDGYLQPASTSTSTTANRIEFGLNPYRTVIDRLWFVGCGGSGA